MYAELLTFLQAGIDDLKFMLLNKELCSDATFEMTV